ncbi:ABC transporter permease [Spiribacter vilamensis]|uniref:Arginine ABC transporter permease protein ArtM n=1 Tax=Spiribacter vilamensis TaxID=531306 RepID=A0A4Q8CYQ0_9GAMM|nr:ABC transporter permease [Spiribacter vilamensis]RZU98094.1 amino acid ABC transporter membrane protein 2 (PAAT family) [Spiribacter vilamensis]TVO61004.1 ABC transporter permease [Spiribacter vilamensis]
MNWSVMIESLPALAEGALLTLELVAVSGVLGFMLAVPVAMARVSDRWWIRLLPMAHIYFFRGTPLLVQIYLVYYGTGQFEAIRSSILWPYLSQAYWCAIIAFTLNTSAYTAEILRGAIQAVPRGEVEAARAVGMGSALIWRRIRLPRAFRIALPAYSNEVILMLKGSALASTITLMDLTGVARTIIARTYTPMELFLAAGLVYGVLTVIILSGFRLLERRLNRHLQPH